MNASSRAWRMRLRNGSPVVAPPADIARQGRIRYGTSFDSPPQEFLDESGNPAGSDVDIGIAVAELMGVDVEWIALDFATITEALQANQCDVINSAFSYTQERDHVIDYALYGLFSDVIIVEAANPMGITSTDDLSGKTLGWVTGYATEGLEEIAQELGAKGLEPFRMVAFSTEADALGSLLAGETDAATMANVQGDFYVSKHPGDFKLVSEIQLFRRRFGFGVREGEERLQAALSQAIDMLYENGTLWDVLRRWNIMSTADRNPPPEHI